MKYTQFIEGCKHAKEVEKYVASHVTKTYMPYAEKIAAATRIVEASSFVDVAGERKFQENSPIRFALYVRVALEYYTDISFEDEKFTDVYDAIAGAGLLDTILDAIGEDLVDFRTVIQMVHDDMIINERDFTSFVEEKVNAFAMALEALSEVIQQNNNTSDESAA